MPESSVLLNEINKVFIPCRTVLEMEALTSLFLDNHNYELLRELPKGQPTSQQLIDVFRVIKIEPLERIIQYFIDVVVNRLKPIVMYARDHHDRYRMGNVAAYTQTRVCLYLALHRLKLKFLIIKHFMDQFKGNKYQLTSSQDEGYRSFLSSFHKNYADKNLMNLKLMLSSKRMSERVSELVDDHDIITNEDIIQALSFKQFLDDNDRIKFVMREIKASLFVCKIMFAKIDVPNPFTIAKETMTDAEEIMISQDFLPELIRDISSCIANDNTSQTEDCFTAYDFFMNRVLEGINNGIKIASGGEIILEDNDTIYSTGNLFEI
ncbi:MAG: hypothetical protein ACFFKA_07825 [Candidatus Thorarchaeota archaeon]